MKILPIISTLTAKINFELHKAQNIKLLIYDIDGRLVEVLKDEKIAGAGLDVYDKEPLPQDHKLRFLPNALLLPHIGYVTAENYSKFYNQMLENLLACLNEKPLRVIS